MGSQPPNSTTDSREVAARIGAQRRQLLKASAVIDMCRFACASKYEGFDPDQLADALMVADNLIDHVTGELEECAGYEATREQGDDIEPRLVAVALRKDAALLLQQHPHLHAVHAQFLRAAAVIEKLTCAECNGVRRDHGC